MNLITLFDRAYPQDKQMEGIAISQSVVSGECFKCLYYKRCSSDRTFCFPPDAPCMKRKRRLMESGEDVSNLDTSEGEEG